LPEITNLSKIILGNFQFRPHELFCWLLDDVLACFGRRIEQPPPEKARKAVVDMASEYARAVSQHEPFTDLLGPLYEELASKGDKRHWGQYFTPQTVADFMAQMTLAADPFSEDRLTRVCEPCSGSGVMLLSFARTVLSRHGAQALERLSLTAIDLDPICSLMTAVQLLGNCLVFQHAFGEVVVYRGNALLNEDFQPVIHMIHEGFKEELPPADHPARIEAIKSVVQQRHAATTQPALFDLDWFTTKKAA
jgi:hypothetical protein